MLPIMENLKGKVAVMGGTGVLCSAMAKELARQGVQVAILGRNMQKADRIVEDIQANKGEAIAVECNVLDVESVRKAEETIRERNGVVTTF